MHASCSICGDIFTGKDPEVLHTTPCGHIFHYVCLIEWLQRSNTCPHCRSKVDEKKIIKLYFQINNYAIKDSGTLENEVQSLKFQIKMKDVDLKKLTEEASKAKVVNKELRTTIISREDEIRTHQSVLTNLHSQIKMLKSQVKTLTEAQLRIEELQVKLKQYESLEKVLNGSAADTAEALAFMKDVTDPGILCSCISTLKKELSQYKQKSRDFQSHLKLKETQLASAVTKLSVLQKQYSILDRSLGKVKEDLSYTEKENESLKNKCKHLEEAIISPSSSSSGCNPRDKALRRLINEFPTPNLQNTSTIDLDISVTTATNKREALFPISPVTQYKAIRNTFLLNKRKVLPKAQSNSDTHCYDGLGGHLKEEVPLTDPAVLLNAIEKSKSNRILAVPKRTKMNTARPQPNLLQFGVKKL